MLSRVKAWGKILLGRGGQRKFSTHLLHLMIAGALPIVVLVVAASLSAARSHRAQVLEEVEAASRSIAVAVDRELRIASASLGALSLSEAVAEALLARPEEALEAVRRFHEQAAALIMQRPHALLNVVLLDVEGLQVANSLVPPGVSLPSAASLNDYTLRPGVPQPDAEAVLATVLAERRPVVSDYMYGPIAQRNVVVVLVPVERDGEVIGVLTASLFPERLSALLSEQRPEGVAALIDSRGYIIARSVDAEQFVGTRATDEIQSFLASGAAKQTRTTMTKDGTYAYGSFHRVGDGSWTAAYGRSRAAVDAPARQAALLAAGGGALALAAFGLIGYCQGRRLGKEMRALAQDAAAIGLNGAMPHRPEQIREVAEVRQALRASVSGLAESEERFRLAIMGTGLATWDLDAGTGELVWSSGLIQMLGMSRTGSGPIRIHHLADRVHPEDRAAFLETWDRASRDRQLFHAVYRILRESDKAPRWLEFYGRGMSYDSGDRVLGVTLDVTERKAAEERQTLLMNEVDHRSKNALALVQAILRLTRSDDARVFARTVGGRVEALARAHELLARGSWQGAELHELAALEFAATAKADQVACDGAPVRLAPNAVQPVSMVLHELTTNATKYGALSCGTGTVALHWALQEPDGRLSIIWKEQGGPPVSGPPAATGFGSQLITRIVEGQLRGAVTFDWAPEGLTCVFSAAADAVVRSEAPVRQSPSAQASDHDVPDLHGLRVLVVEDEPLIAADLAAVLEQAGCAVVGPAGSLSHAAGLAATAPLDAAVLDVNLMGECSLSVAKCLVARGVPVVLVTGYSRIPYPSSVLDCVADTLRKPVDAEHLLRALGRARRG